MTKKEKKIHAKIKVLTAPGGLWYELFTPEERKEMGWAESE